MCLYVCMGMCIHMYRLAANNQKAPADPSSWYIGPACHSGPKREALPVIGGCPWRGKL